MLKTWIYLSALVLSPMAQASFALPWANGISRVENPAPSASGATGIYTSEFSVQDVNSCIASLCGPALQNRSATDVLMNIYLHPSRTAQNAWAEHFETQSRELVRLKKKARVLEAQYLQKAVDSHLDFPASGPLRALAGFIKVFSSFASQLSSLTTYDDGIAGMTIDTQKYQAMLATKTDNQKIIIRFLVENFLSPSLGHPYDPAENQLTARLKQLYPSLDLKTAQQKDARAALETRARIAAHLGPLADVLFIGDQIKIIEKASLGVDLNTVDSTRYVNAVMSLHLIQSLFRGEIYKASQAEPVDFQGGIQNLISSGVLQNRLALTQGLDEEKVAGEISQQCQARLQTAIDLGASGFRVTRLNKLIADVKESAKRVAARWVDVQERENLRKAIDTLEFSMPLTNEETLSNLQSTLDEERDATLRDLDQMKDTPEAYHMALLGMMFQTADSKDKMDLVKDSNILQACNKLVQSPLTDATVTSIGKILLSSFTARYPEVGAAVIAHEIGHAVSARIRSMQLRGAINQAFSNSLTCIARRNPFTSWSTELSKKWNTTYSEEDWADHFSSAVMDDLTTSTDSGYARTNIACSLVQNYQFFGASNYNDNKLVPDDKDPHSSGFLRLLLVAHDRRQVTPQCQKFLDPIAAAGRNLTCR